MMTRPTVHADDEVAVRAVEEAYDRAWCAGDLDALVACLTEDAVLVNPRGQVASGEQEIRAALGQFLAGEARGSRHSSVVERISFATDAVAIIDGRAVISNLSTTDGQSELEHGFTDVLVKEDGVWRIAHVRAYGLEGRTR